MDEMWGILMIAVWLFGDSVEKTILMQQELVAAKLHRRLLEKVLEAASEEDQEAV